MALLEELSTIDLAARDRLSFWNEIASRMVAPVRVQTASPDDFQGRMYRRRFRDIEIVSPCSSPARICSAEGANVGVLNLQLQHIGRSTNFTGGRHCELDEGDFVLYDPAQPLEVSFTEFTQVLTLRLPLAYTEERLPRLKQMVGIKMRGDSGASAIFSAFLRNTWRHLQTDDGDWADALDDVLWPLLDIAYAAERAEATDATRREERRRALFAVIEENLCDPDLDARRIARRLGVSARYIQMLFAELSTTPTAFIQRQRLELAARRLERDGAKAAITDVAFDVGFNDLSSFCRAFRRRFDVSPRDYRAGLRRSRVEAVALN